MPGYDVDFALWAAEQAALLRSGRVAELDRDNLAEELDTLARALGTELFERFARLLQNLLQWEYLSLVRPPAWYIAIHEERGAIPLLLADAPSLRRTVSETYAKAWQVARERASNATGLALHVFPSAAPYSYSQALDVVFWPGDPERESEPI